MRSVSSEFSASCPSACRTAARCRELELDIGRAAVIAGAGARRRFHLPSRAFISSGRSCRPERTEPWQAMVAAIRSSRACSVSAVSLSAISSARSRISGCTLVSPSIAGVSRTAIAPGPKRSMPSPKWRSVSECMASAGASSSGRSTISGKSSICAGTGRDSHRLLQRLVDQPLMRRMLVDDDQRIARLRDDVVLVDLRTRRAERRRHERPRPPPRHRRAHRRCPAGRHRIRPALSRQSRLFERPRWRAREIEAGGRRPPHGKPD